jgi:hypothetical protein
MTTYRVDGGRRTAASVVHLIGTVLALILVAHILFVVFHARPDNPLANWAAHSSDVIGLWFTHLFQTGDHVFTVAVDYGLAAVFWLVVTGVIATILRNVG